jgi:hypothetical protein
MMQEQEWKSYLLSDLQEVVLKGFSYGLKRSEIASELELPPERVDYLVAQVYAKLSHLDKIMDLESFIRA